MYMTAKAMRSSNNAVPFARAASVLFVDGHIDDNLASDNAIPFPGTSAVLFVDGALSDDVVGLGFVPEVDGGERIHCV